MGFHLVVFPILKGGPWRQGIIRGVNCGKPIFPYKVGSVISMSLVKHNGLPAFNDFNDTHIFHFLHWFTLFLLFLFFCWWMSGVKEIFRPFLLMLTSGSKKEIWSHLKCNQTFLFCQHRASFVTDLKGGLKRNILRAEILLSYRPSPMGTYCAYLCIFAQKLSIFCWCHTWNNVWLMESWQKVSLLWWPNGNGTIFSDQLTFYFLFLDI